MAGRRKDRVRLRSPSQSDAHGKPRADDLDSMESPSSGLDALDSIDILARQEDGSLLMVILHAFDWDDEYLKRLTRKIDAYLAFLQGGQVDEKHPDWYLSGTWIELSHQEPLTEVVRAQLEHFGAHLAETHGVGFRTSTGCEDGLKRDDVTVEAPRPPSPVAALRGGMAFTAFVRECLLASGSEPLEIHETYVLQREDWFHSTRRLWELCRQRGEVHLVKEVDHYVKLATSEPRAVRAAAPIVPLIRTRELMDVEGQLASLGMDGDVPASDLHVPFCGPLVVCYALDQGDRFGMVWTSVGLSDLGLDKSSLHRVAVENLDRVVPEVKSHKADGTCMMLTAGGDYEASLLLLPWLCDQLATELAGELIACVPARDLLFVTGSEDVAGLSDIRERVAGLDIEHASRLWDGLMVWREARWQVYEK